MISRYGGCTFEEKVRNAGNANFTAAIVYNKDSNKVFRVINIYFAIFTLLNEITI